MSKSDRYIPCPRCHQPKDRVHGPCTMSVFDSRGIIRSVFIPEHHWARACACVAVTR